MPANELLVVITGNGQSVTFNDYSSGAPVYILRNTAKLLSGLGTRQTKTPNQGSHGVSHSLAFEEERALPFEGEINATSQSDCKAKERLLTRCLALPLFQSYAGKDGSVLLQITDVDGVLYQFYANILKYPEYDILDNVDPSRRSFDFLMVAKDPNLYSQTLQSQTGSETVVGTNFSVIQGVAPRVPFSLIANTVHSVGCVSNGIVDAPPLITITGPTTNPVVQNTTTGKKMSLTRFGGLTLLAGETCQIDVVAYTIKKFSGGVATDASGFLSTDSNWISIQPGSNDVTLIDDSPDHISATLLVQWRDSYR